jgi:hypothetical protein
VSGSGTGACRSASLDTVVAMKGKGLQLDEQAQVRERTRTIEAKPSRLLVCRETLRDFREGYRELSTAAGPASHSPTASHDRGNR